MRGKTLRLLVVCLLLVCAGAVTVGQTRPQLKEVANIKGSNTRMGDHFGNGGTLEGHGVALSGDGTTLAVAAPYESSSAKGINGNQNDNSVYSAGSVYIFVQRNSTWSQQAYVKPSNPGQSTKFGYHI